MARDRLVMTGGELREWCEDITKRDEWFTQPALVERLWQEVQSLDTEIRILKTDNTFLRGHEAWKISRRAACLSYRDRIKETFYGMDWALHKIDAVPLTEDK